MCVCPYGTFLSLNSSYRINLDVFLIDAEDDLYGFTESTKNCSFFQFFHCPEELFVSFSSILIRLFINCVMNVFNFLKVSLADEKKILFLMVKHAKIFLDKFWYTTNHKFFYDFFNQFEDINCSSCFEKSTRIKHYCQRSGHTQCFFLMSIIFDWVSFCIYCLSVRKNV